MQSNGGRCIYSVSLHPCISTPLFAVFYEQSFFYYNVIRVSMNIRTACCAEVVVIPAGACPSRCATNKERMLTAGARCEHPINLHGMPESIFTAKKFGPRFPTGLRYAPTWIPAGVYPRMF